MFLINISLIGGEESIKGNVNTEEQLKNNAKANINYSLIEGKWSRTALVIYIFKLKSLLYHLTCSKV